MKHSNEMTPVELDQAIAREVMGWTLETVAGDPEWICARDGEDLVEVIRGPRGDTCGCWMPSSLISDAFAAEEEIERRLMSTAYAENLMKIAWRGKSGRSTWYLIHASPLARCLAMLATVRSRDTKKPADLRSWDECQHEFFGTPMDIAIGRGRTCIRCGMAE